ncbi:type II toxin-antitoxin system RelE/ParE family toxin [Pseudidiomarina aquimaris]|uniref:type II toxin-antitoxin system RelE/ParE family toxin n=1 Tax=Pseudidiomarina aquimaris TaxID=641841 RepID=UPI003A96C42D
MVEIIWTEPALDELDAIAAYIAVDNPKVAQAVVETVLSATEVLSRYPDSGRRPPELPQGRYREIVVPPCRIFYRIENDKLYLVHVQRDAQQLREIRY